MSVKGPEPSSEPVATSLSHREMDQTRRSRYLARATVGLLLGVLASVAHGQNITEFPIPTASAAPYGIAAGPDGALWFTEGAVNQIGRITIAGAITEFAIPTPGSAPYGIAAGPDGAVWFTESSGNKIGRITIAGVIDEIDVSAVIGTRLTGITVSPNDIAWFAEVSNNMLGGIFMARNSRTGFTQPFLTATTQVPTPSAGSYGITVGPDGALWFTEQMSNKIGRFTTGSSAGSCTPSSANLCLNSGRFKVEVSWSVPSQGTSGVGTVVPLTGDAGVVWFFSANNHELMVKVLDGRAVNGRFWFFSAPGTNVRYTITVTDTVNNVVKTYTNLEGQVTNIQDTGGFFP